MCSESLDRDGIRSCVQRRAACVHVLCVVFTGYISMEMLESGPGLLNLTTTLSVLSKHP